MIPTSALFEQSTLALLCEHDRVVQRYRTLFALFDWDVLPTRAAHLPGPHPPSRKRLHQSVSDQTPVAV